MPNPARHLMAAGGEKDCSTALESSGVMDAFSERFVNAVRSRLPGLLPHLRPASDGESVELRLTAPSGHGNLFVTTAGEEVTVGFGPWHGHYEEVDCWPSDGAPRSTPFERVLTLLADFLRDLVVIRVWTRGGHYAGSGPWHWWYAGEGCRADCPGDHYALLSWSGRGDLLPPVPVDPEERRRWLEQMATQAARR
jgi:hypothetical protein